jgi:2,4-dienoyl-CoA reductase-like NADH-dependent reductase (Old Yellow Enzyme family)
MADFQYLFTPLRIGNVTVENRIVAMPHTTLLSTDHLIGDRHVAYYAERAKGGAGLVIVETLIIHPTSQPLMNEAFAFDERGARYRGLPPPCAGTAPGSSRRSPTGAGN